MPRIYKGSTNSLKLFVPCNIGTNNIEVILFTNNPNKGVLFTNVEIVNKNNIIVDIKDYALNSLEDGVIKYIIRDNNEILSTERQSNYYLVTPDNYTATSIETQNLKTIEITENGNYEIIPDKGFVGLEKVDINVNLPIDDIYNNAYNNGVEDGIHTQKSKLEHITIVENGTYEKEDGYDYIEVNVPDVNGSYADGYGDGFYEGENQGFENGYNSGIEEGYSNGFSNGEKAGYDKGIADGTANAGEIIAQTAQVLDITENGIYLSKYCDSIIPDVTGYYNDGTPFYNYAKFENTQIKFYDLIFDHNTKVEIWWKGKKEFKDQYIFSKNSLLDFALYLGTDGYLNASITTNSANIRYQIEDDKWYHFEMSQFNGFWVNGEKIGDFDKKNNIYFSGTPFRINSSGDYGEYCNGYYGMLKINDVAYIPRQANYFNTLTNNYDNIEFLKNFIGNTDYTFFENKPIYADGNLIKRVNVNVPPKINVEKEKIRFGYSQFTEIPSFYDFSNLFNGVDLFNQCTKLEHIPFINTSNVNDMTSMFASCSNLKEIPAIDTSNVTKMEKMLYYNSSLENMPWINTSKVTNMYYMFYYCEKLKTIPEIDTSNVTNVSNMFQNCKALNSLPPLNFQKATSLSSVFGYSNLDKLTDVGGFINLKQSWNDNNGLARLPNLKYESCINILNGLYNFTENGETPTSSQGKLKVHSNFIALVGDEISIGTNKGWQITA